MVKKERRRKKKLQDIFKFGVFSQDTMKKMVYKINQFLKKITIISEKYPIKIKHY